MDNFSIYSKKNPSREDCELIIKRILNAEIREHGQNRHFRFASDFMSYFESLYLASDALTKQVQRAVKSLNMPKDASGYFIPNKTAEELAEEKGFRDLFQKAHVSVESLADCTPYFLHVDQELQSYLIHMISRSPLFENKYQTIVETCHGIILYTKDYNSLHSLISSLII